MASEPEPSATASGWATYVTFNTDLDPASVKSEQAKFLSHEKEYPAKLKQVAPNQVLASPAETIDAGKFYVLLDGIKRKDGAPISTGVLRFGLFTGSHP